MDDIRYYFDSIEDTLKISEEVLDIIVKTLNLNPTLQKVALKNLDTILKSKSTFKLLELEMWLKNFPLEFNVQTSEENGKFVIKKRPIIKIEPNSLRINTKSCGPIQFRVPPNTIKKAIKNNVPIAQYYVITEKTFYNGINYIDIAFPIFENFFVHKQRKTIFLCLNDKVKQRLENLAKEEIIGPTIENLIDSGLNENEAKEFYNELQLFAFKIKDNNNLRSATIYDYVDIHTFQNDYIKINDVEITKNRDIDFFKVKENGENLGYIDLSKWEPVTIDEDFSLYEPGKESEFGVYFFDPSTGFDPDRLTSSFIIWIGNGKGMIVDPLTSLPQYLDRKRINRNDIDFIFLTHVHSDHDDGVLEQILSGKVIQVVTSKIVMDSFKRKVKAITEWDEKQIDKLILFKEIKPNEVLKLNDKTSIKIDYAFHPIPTCRFVVTYNDESKNITKSISYSGDTNFDPEYVNKLVNEGKLSKNRAKSILGFIWDSDLIIHDTGGGIHTDIKNLLKLPEDIQKKIIAIHIHELPAGVTIKQALKGEEIILVKSDNVAKYRRLARQIEEVILFQELTEEQRLEVMETARRERFKKGDTILKLGESAKKFYIIHSGEVEIVTKDKRTLYLGKGDYFGEMAFFQNDKVRNATIFAKTDVELLSLAEDKFMKYKNHILDTYKNIVENRPLLSKITFFKMLSEKEINALSSLFIQKTYTKGEYIIRYGEVGDKFYIVKYGMLNIIGREKDGKEKLINQIGTGDTFGEIALIEKRKRGADVVVESDKAIIISIDKKTFERIISEYPGIALGLEEIKKIYTSITEERL